MVKRKTLLLIVVVFAIVLSFFAALFAASATENFIFTENLTMSEPEYRNYGGSEYIVNMTKGDTYVGKIYLGISGYQSQMNNSAVYYLTLQVPYQTGIEKDSISFTIANAQVRLYMETNDQDLTPAFSNNGAEHAVAINNLGQSGQYTITYRFQLQIDISLQQIPVEIELSAHQIQPLQLTSLKAHIAFNAELGS